MSPASLLDIATSTETLSPNFVLASTARASVAEDTTILTVPAVAPDRRSIDVT